MFLSLWECSNPEGIESLPGFSFGGSGHKGQNGGNDQANGSDQAGLVKVFVETVDPAVAGILRLFTPRIASLALGIPARR